MWFPYGVWHNIIGFLLPIWGRNPWLKKYNQVVASLPNVIVGQQPSGLYLTYPIVGGHDYKFMIELYYLNWDWICRGPFRPFGFRVIKIYTLIP